MHSIHQQQISIMHVMGKVFRAAIYILDISMKIR